MDYMVELAQHRDLLEAIELEPDSSSPALAELRSLSFLATEHPNSWIVAAVHAFYADPGLASRVWVNLRYCARFKHECTVRDEARGRNWSARAADKGKAVLTSVKRRMHGGADHARPEPPYQPYPAPPKFLKEVMEADTPPGKMLTARQIDHRTRELFASPCEVRRIAKAKNLPVPFAIVQEGELEQIRATRRDLDIEYRDGRHHGNPGEGRHSARSALDDSLFGLAFSGGGIRSATFNLGVLQALSQIGLLKHVDYLSTVSGGGYIGTWLAGWIRRELDDAQKRRLKQPNPPAEPIGAEVMNEIQRRLAPARYPNPMDERVRPIRFLREYSNYLTPRTGFLSADTWTMLGIYVRNTLLNQVIVVSFAAAVLLAPRNWYALTERLSIARWPQYLAVLLWAIGAAVLTLNLRRLDPRTDDEIVESDPEAPAAEKPAPPWFARPQVIQLLVVVPWVLASGLLAVPLSRWTLNSTRPTLLTDLAHLPQMLGLGPTMTAMAARAISWMPGASRPAAGLSTPSSSVPWAPPLTLGIVMACSFGLILWIGRADRCWPVRQSSRHRRLTPALTILGSAAIAGAVHAALVWLLFTLIQLRDSAGPHELQWHENAFVAPGLLSALSLSIVVLLGMLGERFPDEHREWWSRLRTVVHIYAIVWLLWFIAAIYAPWGLFLLVGKTFGTKTALGALATWIGSTLFGVMKGPAAEVARKQQAESATVPPRVSAVLLRYGALIAPYVFAVGLVLGISFAIDGIYRHNASDGIRTLLYTSPRSSAAYWRHAVATANGCWLWTLGCVALGLLFSWRVNVNEFSVHHFYKNRLVRCYLGASHAMRKADWFTGFDPNDDLRLGRFDHRSAANGPAYTGPYPLVNCALNLVGGQDLAWQERKATSFVFTPKYCGYDVDRAVLTKHRSRLRSEGYVPTTGFYRDGEGPLLGMAMAISGAAANPNMGRASSPALGFLMTVFNVRLGWWIGNPRHAGGVSLPGPGFGLRYTAMELAGATDDTRKFVNLSDGGHFDNLGVYELIRRNCRYIVVCDAGQDDRMIGEDLGDLIRRCRTDFGVEIDIALDRIRDRPAGFSQAHCVVGRIRYLNMPKRNEQDVLVDEHGQPVKPGMRPAPEEGYLVYIKPSMTGDEPQDILEYCRRIPEFPHQSTADQWFGESQFESYRKLGMHIGGETFGRFLTDDSRPVQEIESLFENLYHYWYPPALAIADRSTEHAAEYSRIMERVRSTGLDGLDHTLFEGLPPAATGQLSARDEFYVCNALLQLMENVYADLDLEHNWNHPHVEGWMNVFGRWARQESFQNTWKVSGPTYAARFQRFYLDRLRTWQPRTPDNHLLQRVERLHRWERSRPVHSAPDRAEPPPAPSAHVHPGSQSGQIAT